MHRLTNRLFLAVAASALLAAASIPAYGGGIEVPMQDSRAAAQADAFTASADDAAAIFYNPACMTLSRGTQVSIGELTFFPDWHFDATGGGSESMRFLSYLPHVYASSDLGTERLRVGVGVSNEFGSMKLGPPGTASHARRQGQALRHQYLRRRRLQAGRPPVGRPGPQYLLR